MRYLVPCGTARPRDRRVRGRYSDHAQAAGWLCGDRRRGRSGRHHFGPHSRAGLSSLPVHGATLRGDVDGDGTADSVAVHCRPGGVPVLVVSTANGVVARPLRTTGCGVNARVVVLAEIDRVPGAEVVVQENSGRSAFFARVYTLRNHRLALMKIAGPRLPVPLGQHLYVRPRCQPRRRC